MSKLVIKNNNGNIEGYLNEYKEPLNNNLLDALFQAMNNRNIDDIAIKNNELTLLIGGNTIVIEDYDAFVKNTKYPIFIEKCQKKIASKNEENIAKAKKNKPKVNRKSSVGVEVKKTIIALALIGAGAITINNLINTKRELELNNANHKEDVIATEVSEISPEEAEIVPESTPMVDSNLYQAQESYLIKESFDATINNYASEKGINPSEISWLLYNNNIYDNERINHFKTLIDYMSYFRNNGYNIEIITTNYGESSGILMHNYSKFIIIPENIENIRSIVQLNPSGTSAYYGYTEILNDIKSGNIPNYILLGTANSEPDFNNYANGNLLKSVLEYTLNKGISIQNIGILGYENSGQSALLNAGKILEDYPYINVRVANLDAFYINNYLSEVNKVLNGEYSAYTSEIRALIDSNAEILNIIPHTAGYGISSTRPNEALTESMNLANIFSNVEIITTNTASYEDFPMEAYRLYVLNYLAGQINKYDIINGTNYFIPDVNYNEETNQVEYQASSYTNNDVINDTIYFG